ncbi:PKD domain-containing protein [Candidatus Acetothermia bacterium]|nr:PKD domain-containing protein [Candidatus Acetothermia bacterium]
MKLTEASKWAKLCIGTIVLTLLCLINFFALAAPGLDDPLFVSNRDGEVTKIFIRPDDGKVDVSTCIGKESKLGELDGLAFNDDGTTMIIADETHHTIVKAGKGIFIELKSGCKLNAQFPPSFNPGLDTPKLLNIDKSGDVIGTDGKLGRIFRFKLNDDNQFTIIYDFGKPEPNSGLNLVGLAIEPITENLYVGRPQTGEIFKFNRNPKAPGGYDTPPTLFATIPDDPIHPEINNKFIAGLQFNITTGDLYIASFFSGKLFRIQKAVSCTPLPCNTPVEVFATGFSHPDGVAIELDGDIFIADATKFDPEKPDSTGCVKEILATDVKNGDTAPKILACGLPYPDDLLPLSGAGSFNHPPQKPPVPDILQDQQCTTVTIDGSGATDPDGDKLSFKWELIAAPPGISVPRTLSSSPKLTFSPTQPGIYRVRLTVSDGRGGTATVETSIKVIPSLGCDFIPGEKDFELMMNALVHHIYEVIVDTNHARSLISQNRSEALITDSIDRALDLMGEIPADFAELFGQLDNMDETLTEFLTLVETRAEDADITPLQQALFIKIKGKLEMMQSVLLDMRNELDSLRDTLDSGDPNVADVRQALEQARAAVNDGDLASAKSNLNDAYQRLRIARREQARVLAKEKIVQRRFVEINGILPRAFAVLNDDPKVIPATPSAQPIRLQTKGSISLWILPQRDGSFTLQAQGINVKTIRLEMYALSGERLVLRSANGNVVTVKPTDEQGHSLANGVYLILITVETKGHQIERQVHKITVLQK